MKLTKQKLFSLIESVINENKSDNVLKFMIDLKKFGGIEEFYKRVKIDYNHPDDAIIFYLNLFVDDKLVGTVSYDLILPTAKFKCKPNPIKKDEKVFVLKTIARDPEVGGYRIGKLISFLSVCILGHNNCWVTSDRNTSQEAGKNLVSALKVMNAKKSKPFDYVGWFKTTVQTALEEKEDFPFFIEKIPEDFINNAGVKKYIHNLYNIIASKSNKDQILKQKYAKEVVVPLLNALNDHLVPLTTDTIDDCKPSVNLTLGGESEYIRAFPTEEGIKFLKKMLKMNMEQIQNLFDSDERVQGFSFQFDDNLIKSGLSLIEKINKIDELGSSYDKGSELFDRVYQDSDQVDHKSLNMNIMNKFPKNNK